MKQNPVAKSSITSHLILSRLFSKLDLNHTTSTKHIPVSDQPSSSVEAGLKRSQTGLPNSYPQTHPYQFGIRVSQNGEFETLMTNFSNITTTSKYHTLHPQILQSRPCLEFQNGRPGKTNTPNTPRPRPPHRRPSYTHIPHKPIHYPPPPRRLGPSLHPATHPNLLPHLPAAPIHNRFSLR